MDSEAMDKWLWVKALSVDCSFGRPLAVCPLTEIRKMDIVERLSVVDQMPEQKVDDILVHHLTCFTSRKG